MTEFPTHFMLRRLRENSPPNPPLAYAPWESLTQGYGKDDLRADPLAGLPVGAIAMPLVMAPVIVGGLILSLMAGSIKAVDVTTTLKIADNNGIVKPARSNGEVKK